MSALLPSITRQLMPMPVDASVHFQDPFLYIDRQSRQLQRDFQILLDAQSAGLSAGFSGPTQDDILSNGSSTPTPSLLSSPRSAVTIPVRQPLKKKIGLRSARRGILKSMNDILSIKEQELRIISSEFRDPEWPGEAEGGESDSGGAQSGN